MKRVLLSIFGGSGSGKSTLAKALVASLGEEVSVRVPTDYFLESNPFNSRDEFLRRPLQYDWARLETFLQAENGTVLTTPCYDFERFTRLAETGGRSLTIRSIVILDGMRPFPKVDLLMYLKTPAAERKKRIRDRDRLWGTNVIDKWALHQMTMKDVFRLQYPIDLQLEGLDSIDLNVMKIRSLLEARALVAPVTKPEGILYAYGGSTGPKCLPFKGSAR